MRSDTILSGHVILGLRPNSARSHFRQFLSALHQLGLRTKLGGYIIIIDHSSDVTAIW